METVVIGASGYAGGELLRLIDSHPKLIFKSAVAHSKANTAIALEHPFLSGKYDQNFEEFNAQNIQTTDVVFIALPHGESTGLVPQLKPGTKIVDLGADFRLKDSNQSTTQVNTQGAGPMDFLRLKAIKRKFLIQIKWQILVAMQQLLHLLMHL